MRVTHAEFVEYFECHARAHAAEARMKELRERILPHLQEGNASPIDLPYKLTVRTSNRTKYDWKGALAKVLKGLLRSEKKVAERMVKIEAEFEVVETPSLVVSVNDQYAAEELSA